MLKGLGKWKVLNSRETKALLSMAGQQWGSELALGSGFLEGRDGDIFLISRGIEQLDIENLHVDSLGLYFGQLRNDELRLSIEGSQLVGKTATRNVLEINDEQLKQWLGGNSLELQPEGCSGYVIVKHNSDFLGCGKCKGSLILNFVPKARRITV